MNNAVSDAVQATEGKRKLRYVFFAVALVLAVVSYRYIVDLFDPNNDIITQLKRAIVQESYTFSSGSEGGFYIQIGQALENATRKGAPIVITNRKSLGGEENARRVMVTPRSFGLVQEDTIPEGDFVRKHIDYITPLYLERMHIIYDYHEYESFLREDWPTLLESSHAQPTDSAEPGQEKGAGADRAAVNQKDRQKPDDSDLEPPKLSEKLTKCRVPEELSVLAFLEHARMSPGPVGSGSRLFATYLFEICNIRPKNVLDIKFDEAIDRLGDDIDIVFTIAGAPLEIVRRKLETCADRRFRLMAIDPALVPALNNRFKLKLRAATFKDKYRRSESISTIGTWAFLIASKDVPRSASLQVLRYLEDSKQAMRTNANLDSNQTFQLDEFDFYAGFEVAHSNYLMDVLRSLLIFAVTVALNVSVIMVFLSWANSEFRKIRHFRELMDLYRDYLPTNTRLIPDSTTDPTAVPRPVIYKNQREISSKLIKGMSLLLELSGRVRGAYENGEITMKHYDHLVGSIELMKGIFQRNLAQRFNEVLQTGGEVPNLRHYYTAGYLRREDFRDLEREHPDTVKRVTGEPVAQEETMPQAAGSEGILEQCAARVSPMGEGNSVEGNALTETVVGAKKAGPKRTRKKKQRKAKNPR